jgi:hypothetical protein
MIPKLTAAGKNLLLRALTGETINFTKIQIGNGPAQEAAGATALVNPLLTIDFTKIELGEEYVTLTSTFTNGTVTSGFHITEAGFFATDPDNESKEILYAIGNENESTADYVPDNQNRILEMQFDALIFIGDAENVTAAINNSLVYATADEFNAHTSDTNNPHGVTKEQIGLGNVPNVSTNNQAPTYLTPTTLATLTSGERLGTAFGKIRLAITTLIDHLSNKDNPHEVTAEQVNAAAKSHTHSTTDINSGTLSVLRGGTGLSSPKSGGLLMGRGSLSCSALVGVGALYAAASGVPTFGTLPVFAGGTGCSNLSDLAEALTANGVPKIVTGKYTGTGNYGSSNKNKLTFSSAPKLLIVMPASNTNTANYGGFIAITGMTACRAGGITDDVSNASSQLYFEWGSDYVSWYNSGGSAYYQQNAAMSYAYLAIL